MRRFLHYGGIRIVPIALLLGGVVTPVSATTTEESTEPTAALCGEIIVPANFWYEEQEEDRREIEDCDNPFNADASVSYLPSVTIYGQLVTLGDTVTMPIEPTTTQVEYTIAKTNPDLNALSVGIFRHDGDDFYVHALNVRSSDSIEPLLPGQYTMVFSYGEVILNQVKPTWFERLRAEFFPTALAYYPDFEEVYALTFTVEAAPPLPPAGASSILFLPGIQASRLYAGTDVSVPGILNDIEQDELLWEPGNNNDVRALAMTPQGFSVNDIYTDDVLDEIYGVNNIYRGFLDFLDELKAAETMPIKEYEAFAYDWRYAVQDIVVSGTRYQQEIKSVVERVEALAADSYTGKVTIVAHSNGGLLAKALISELGRIGKAELVDTLIFIGTPHLGTPKALSTVLHGFDQQQVGGLVIDDEVAREVINNLPGAYALLPSEKYVEQNTEPLITFRAGGAITQPYIAQYGETIGSVTEYINFLSGVEGRSPTQNDISTPYTTNPLLLSQTLASHKNQLDEWVPPAHMAVHNIVGVGLKTIRALEYRDVSRRSCVTTIAGNLTCAESSPLVRPYAHFTQYGDETVTSLSAESTVGETHYFDLVSFNSNLVNPLSTYDHATFAEIPEVQAFVKNILLATTSNIAYFSDSAPTFTKKYYVVSIDSPVRPLATDDSGRQAGIIVEGNNRVIVTDIPGSAYFEMADTKYLLLPREIDTSLTLTGEGEGSYTLTIATLEGDDSQEVLSVLEAATTTPNMVATMSLSEEVVSTIVSDYNNDGVADHETTSDGTPVGQSPVTFTTVRTYIASLGLPTGRAKVLTALLTVAERAAKKSDKKAVFTKITNQTIDRLQVMVTLYERRGWLDNDEAEDLREMLSKLYI